MNGRIKMDSRLGFVVALAVITVAHVLVGAL
jgi:hypothetical protein